jgi:hypothetical protein
VRRGEVESGRGGERERRRAGEVESGRTDALKLSPLISCFLVLC